MKKDFERELDAVIAQMQVALEEERVENPEFYAQYPSYIATEADKEDMKAAVRRWKLPEEYVYFLKHFVPERVGWSTDDYISLEIYGARDLVKGQWGYAYNPVTDEDITDWPASYLVIASDEGDPYCIDLARGDTTVYTAEHGTGSWDFSVACDNLIEFLHSALIPRGYEDWDVHEQPAYKYAEIHLTGEGADKIKTLLFVKKTFSCDVAQAKSLLGELPLRVFKGIETAATAVETKLKSIGADYEKQPISQKDFLSAE